MWQGVDVGPKGPVFKIPPCDLLLYADDSCLVFTGPDVKTIEANLNQNFNYLCDWFVENKLSTISSCIGSASGCFYHSSVF